MADASTLKKVACDAIDAAAGELHTLSQEIWDHPELNFEEKHAHTVRQIFCVVKQFIGYYINFFLVKEVYSLK